MDRKDKPDMSEYCATKCNLPAEYLAEILRLREELDDMRVRAEVHGAGCQCGDDEACAFLRRAEAVEADLKACEDSRNALAEAREYANNAILELEAKLTECQIERDELKATLAGYKYRLNEMVCKALKGVE
jgi:SMC interacting uncharacterized protein involved in chromosome segregation